jgi:hypothetical protein
MTTSETITFLRRFNGWRRGGYDQQPPRAREVGEAIDAACEHLADLEQRFREKCMNEARLQCQLDERWGIRRELETALGVTAGMENDESLRVGLAAIKQLQNERDEARIIAEDLLEKNAKQAVEIVRLKEASK